MKKKTVMRLLAVVLAVSLAATSGVPGTALTGVETVYAANSINSNAFDNDVVADVTSLSFTTTNMDLKNDKFAVSATATTPSAITNDNIVLGKVEANNAGTELTVTFSGLTANTSYTMFYDLGGGSGWEAYTANTDVLKTTKKSLKNETITLDTTEYTYDGTAKKPKVFLNGVDITDDSTNYTIAYADSNSPVNATTATHKTWVSVTATAANATYREKEPGKHSESASAAAETVTINYTINPAPIGNVTFADGSTTCSTVYGASDYGEPTVVVYTSGTAATVLTKGTGADATYTVEYTDNTKVGTATATVTGIGNYTGTKKLTFTITKAAFSTGSFPTVTAQGSKGDKTTDTADTLVIETTSDPDPALYTVEYALSTSTDPSTFTNWQTSKKFTGLTASTKYYVAARVLESANTAASAVNVYADTYAYTTLKPDISAATVTLVSENDTTFTGNTYTGSKIEPARIDVKIGDTLLTGTDYDVEYYYGDTQVTNPINAGTVTVVIKGKNNYSGTNKTATYTIAKKSVTVSVVKDNNGSLSMAYNGTTTYSDAETVKIKGTFKSPYTHAAGDSDISYFTFSGTLASKDKADAVKVTAIDASSAKAYTSANAEFKHNNVNVAQNYNITIDLASNVTAEITAASTLTIGSDNNDDLSISEKKSDVAIAYGQTIDLKMTNPLGLDLEYTFEKPEIAKQYLTLKDGKLTSIKYPGDSFDIVLYVSYPASAASEKTNYDGTALDAEKVTLTIKSSKASLAVTLNGANVTGTDTKALTAALTDGEAKIKAAMGVTARYVTNGKDDDADGAEYVYVPYSKLKFEYAKGLNQSNGFSTTFPTEEGEYTVQISNTDSNIDLASPVKLNLTLDNSAKPIDDSILDGTGDKAQIVNEDGKDMLYKADGTLANYEFVDVDGKTYFANDKGEVVKGKKVTVAGKDYVLDADGVMLTSQLATTQTGNQVYVGKDGAVVKNKVVSVGTAKYYANASGKIVKDGFYTTKSGNTVYATASGKLKYGKVFTVGKYKYFAKKSGVIAKGGIFTTPSGNKVRATKTGKLYVSTTFTYKGVKYKASKNGVLKKVK